MRFVCDSCRAQYMISDDKVGAKGVKVRCKKCGYVILVRRTESEVPEESTKISQNPFADGGAPPGASAGAEGDGEDGATNPSLSATGGAGGAPLAVAGAAPSGENVLADLEDDEIGAVFDQVLRTGPQPSSSEKAEGATGESPSLGGESDEAQSTRVVSLDTLRKLAEESEAKVGDDKGHGANGKAEKGKNGVPQNDWFVAVDDQQVGPLALDKLKDMWDRGQVGAESLCWRAGFSDWIPLSEVPELTAVLAPRPAKPVIVAPAPVSSPAMSPVMSMPVESAFSAGGVATVERGAMQVMAGAPPPTESGAWKPSAASALASLAMQEVEALSRPAPKPAPARTDEHPAAKGLLDLPAPDAGLNGKSSSFPSPGGDTDARIRMSELQRPSYNTYTPPPPAPEPNSSRKLIIAGISAAAVVVVGLIAVVVLLLVRKEPQGMAPPAYAMQQNSGSSALPMPPPPAGTHPVQPAAAAAPGTAAPAPGAPAAAPAVAAATPPAGGAPAATAAKSTLPPAPTVKTGGGSTELASARNTRRTHDEGGGGEVIAPSRKGSGSAAEPGGGEDEFDKEFGGSSGGSKKETASAPKKPGAGYIPPAPGGGGDVPETLGQSDIMSVVVANKSAIVNCVKEQKAKDPGLSGRLVVRWTIQTSGKTSGISVQSEEFKSTYMASCVTGLVRGWTFPRHKVQGTPIDFPFTF